MVCRLITATFLQIVIHDTLVFTSKQALVALLIGLIAFQLLFTPIAMSSSDGSVILYTEYLSVSEGDSILVDYEDDEQPQDSTVSTHTVDSIGDSTLEIDPSHSEYGSTIDESNVDGVVIGSF